MSQATSLILGEHRRLYDERYRISLPAEVVDQIADSNGESILAKERQGCLSLWRPEVWNREFGKGIDIIQSKLERGLHGADLARLQQLSRLLSTRSKPVKVDGRGRFLVPEGFREFLAVEPNNEVMVIGAGCCVEIWRPEVWRPYLDEQMGQFNNLFESLI